MEKIPVPAPIGLPAILARQLANYRKCLWQTKVWEAICQALVVVSLAILIGFISDRIGESPRWYRMVVAAAALVGCGVIPWAIYGWVWRRRTFDQVARLIARISPTTGDQLLGVLELVRNRAEQARSPELCRAAIEQVATSAEQRDLLTWLPPTRWRAWRRAAIASGIVVGGLACLVPQALWNAVVRLTVVGHDVPRYTFAQLADLPQRTIVPHGETYAWQLPLSPDSVWKPPQAQIMLGQQPSLVAARQEDQYRFSLPPQLTEVPVQVRVGDARRQTTLVPTHRPELTAISAEVHLPPYLQRSAPQLNDARSGTLRLLEGSHASLVVRANRSLAEASVDGKVTATTNDQFSTQIPAEMPSRQLALRWRDPWGLEQKAPFMLHVERMADEPPTLASEGLPRQKVVLQTELLAFRVIAQDDFGIQQVGMEWQKLSMEGAPLGSPHEQLLAGGAPDQTSMNVAGTFSAQTLNIEPQTLQVRLFVQDYLPNRPRVYSPPHVLYVLDPQQHAIWMTDQLNKWHRQALEVRDRELQLHAVNQEIRAMGRSELESPATRAQIARQAAAEQANGRRLSGLAMAGDDLVRQAARNPEFGVGHLEKWAEMLQLLKQISAQRMPSVSDLLQEAAQASQQASAESPSAPSAGQDRSKAAAGASEPNRSADLAAKPPAAPGIVDTESSQQPATPSESAAESPPGAASALSLPVTTLVGKTPPAPASCPTAQKLDQAVEEQRQLLAEFEKIAQELNAVLANLEGSTLVKRLKAAAREQYRVATDLGQLLDKTFGVPSPQIDVVQRDVMSDLSRVETQSAEKVSYILDDMQAFFERRPLTQFRSVMEEMKEVDVVGSLRQLGTDLPAEQGLSMAQCEYWSDSLDRWAEDLVDPARGGT